MSQFFKNFLKHKQNTAIIDKQNKITYQSLINSIIELEKEINKKIHKKNTNILFQLPRDPSYPITQFSIWANKGVSVPICHSTPKRELIHFIEDSQCDLIICNEENQIIKDISAQKNIPILVLQNNETLIKQPSQQINNDINKFFDIDQQQPGLILYTSGTTGKPKGVVHSFHSIQSQIESLTEAWQWTSQDHILQILPLNHIHGVQNILNCSLFNGATCEMLPKFEPRTIWEALLRDKNQPNLFMAVPAIYQSLISFRNKKFENREQEIKDKMKNIRLMVSGSSALPKQFYQDWFEISGHKLLERFGMTEVGMALSNPYKGERIPGSVGFNLPQVQSSFLDVDSQQIFYEKEKPGELLIKSEGMFIDYFNQNQLYRDSFYEGWFRTGDMAMINENGDISILGRISQDILKKYGHKISALEVENIIRDQNGVLDCGVVQVEEEICGCIVVDEFFTGIGDLRVNLIKEMSDYKIPGLFKVLEELPRNSMGKVDKKKIRELFILQ